MTATNCRCSWDDHARLRLIRIVLASMLQYTVTGGPDPSALALVTVDSPRIIFAVDPMFALMDFTMSPFRGDSAAESEPVVEQDVVEPVKSVEPKAAIPFAYRVEVVQATVMVLASDSDPRSQAIQLYIKNVVMAQQVRFLPVIIFHY